MGFARNRAAHRIGDAHNESAPLLAVSQRQNGVRGLARLRNEKADIIAENGRVPVEKIASKLDHDGQLGQFFDELTCGHRTVVTGATGDEHDASASLYLVHVVLNAAQSHFELLVVHTASHRVYHGLGLLEDLFLHEVLVVALHYLLDLEHELLDLAVRGLVGLAVALNAVYGQFAFAYYRHVVVFQEDDLVGVLDDGARV